MLRDDWVFITELIESSGAGEPREDKPEKWGPPKAFIARMSETVDARVV